MLTCYPPTKPVRSADPTFEPVTLAEAKAQCNLGEAISDHDQTIAGYIKAAREQLERDTTLAICTGTYTLKLTELCGDWFEINLKPVTSITSIAYIATDGTSTTWSASNYQLETASIPPIVRLTYGSTWPTLRGDINGITVTFVAGYATTLTVPVLAKYAVLLLVKAMWGEQMGEDTKKTMEAYERIAERLMRSTYA